MLCAAAIGPAAALLVACSGSGGADLIPSGNAGPLRADFEAVARAAENGNGKCAETESALSKTELAFAALPSSVNAELRNTLSQGIANLKARALALCSQPLPQSTTQTTTPTTQTTPSTPTTTQTTPTTPTNTHTTSPGGGTPPPEEEPKGSEPGGAGGGAGGAGGAGGEEAGKGTGVEQETSK